MWNMGNADADETQRLIGIIERHGDTVGRDTDEIEITELMAMSFKPLKEREEMLTGLIAMIGQTTPETARDRMIVGSKQECIDKIERFVKAGVTHFIFMQVWPMVVDDEVQAFAEEVIPAFRGG